MQVKILGSAAGGGFPQWNCACSNCARLRAGALRGRARTQAQLAVRTQNRGWCLINASPDLRAQILADSDFAPQETPRSSPIATVVLTSADVDQVMGLLHLREFQPLQIYATREIQEILREENSIFRALEQTAKQADWITIHASKPLELQSRAGEILGLSTEAFAISNSAPSYAGKSRTGDATGEYVIGLHIRADDHSIVVAPTLPRIEENWVAEWNRCDAVLVDGTFWSDDEMTRIRSGSKTASGMGHLPISRSAGMLRSLAKLTKPRKIFYHINNTNPILDEDSPEHAQVTAAGWEIAYDGMEITL
jgi:pyrroloquinoline quinone biosynthesis protein B